MLNSKRVIAATLLGFICGFICYGLASSGPQSLPTAVAIQMILSRALLGFAIGISIFKMGHWTIHGVVMGLIFSLPLAVGGLMAPVNAEFSPSSMFIATLVMGIIYGLLIEFVTTVLLKAKMLVQVKAG